MISDIAAHEFFHVVTPLHIHSEIIENFDFETPVPSEHVWLYEGSHRMGLGCDAAASRSQGSGPLSGRPGAEDQVRRGASSTRTSACRSSRSPRTPRRARPSTPTSTSAGPSSAACSTSSCSCCRTASTACRSCFSSWRSATVSRARSRKDEFFDIVTEMTYPEIGEFFRGLRTGNGTPSYRRVFRGGSASRSNGGKMGRAVRFVIDPEPSPEQRTLRDAWVSNP